jgi:hypothetical protein
MSETKTIREWLQGLPEPYNLLALAELDGDSGLPQEMESSIHGALCAGFQWRRTGYYDFWAYMHQHLEGKMQLPDIPDGYLEANDINWPKESEPTPTPEKPMRYFYVVWEGCIGDGAQGRCLVESQNYVNMARIERRTAKILNEDGTAAKPEDIVITNIIEMSKEDFEEFTRE